MTERQMPRSDSRVPNPDPTLRTVEQLLREIANAREFLESKIAGLRDNIETRLAGMDRAIDLLQTIADRGPALTDEKVAQLRLLHEEKFDSISVQFQERDTRTEQTAAGVKIAVDAALQAAKEAVAEQNRSFALATGKSETATMKQIDALGLAIQNANKTLDDKIADMKERLTRIEGMDLGASKRDMTAVSTQSLQHGSNQNMIALIAAAIGSLGVFVAVAALIYAVMHDPAQRAHPTGGGVMFKPALHYIWDDPPLVALPPVQMP